ncbi:hypothetical protein J132_09814 [Termitomyces sp. J132]|nr:hypothetical protein J132_09814 [Termitomyces sp. J132]
MEPNRDSPPPPYPGDETHPSTTNSVDLRLGESAGTSSGCLPSYQSRSIRRHHPYLRPPSRMFLSFRAPHSRSEQRASSGPQSSSSSPATDSANPSPPFIFVFDPENEHHRRILRLRAVLPDFILGIKRGLEKTRRMQEEQKDNDDSKSPPSEAATE